MKLTARLALAGLLVVATASCSTEPAVRVLFVGNSYTQSNDMPGMVVDLAEAGGRRLEVGVLAPGGWWWRGHAVSGETLDAIAGGDWDFVVTRDQPPTQ